MTPADHHDGLEKWWRRKQHFTSNVHALREQRTWNIILFFFVASLLFFHFCDSNLRDATHIKAVQQAIEMIHEKAKEKWITNERTNEYIFICACVNITKLMYFMFGWDLLQVWYCTENVFLRLSKKEWEKRMPHLMSLTVCLWLCIDVCGCGTVGDSML